MKTTAEKKCEPCFSSLNVGCSSNLAINPSDPTKWAGFGMDLRQLLYKSDSRFWSVLKVTIMESFVNKLQAHLSLKLFCIFLNVIGRNWIIKSMNTQAYKPDLLEMKDTTVKVFPWLSGAKDHICSFADLENHSAFLCLRTLSLECKNLSDKTTNTLEDWGIHYYWGIWTDL